MTFLTAALSLSLALAFGLGSTLPPGRVGGRRLRRVRRVLVELGFQLFDAGKRRLQFGRQLGDPRVVFSKLRVAFFKLRVAFFKLRFELGDPLLGR